jgi:hypothetical protein
MREQDAPAIAEPLVEMDMAFGRVGFEIGRNLTNLQSHVLLHVFCVLRDLEPNLYIEIFSISNKRQGLECKTVLINKPP